MENGGGEADVDMVSNITEGKKRYQGEQGSRRERGAGGTERETAE